MTKGGNTVVTTSVDALNRSLEAPPLDPVVLALANDYLSGKGVNEIADEYGISEDRVTAVIEKKRSEELHRFRLRHARISQSYKAHQSNQSSDRPKNSGGSGNRHLLEKGSVRLDEASTRSGKRS